MGHFLDELPAPPPARRALKSSKMTLETNPLIWKEKSIGHFYFSKKILSLSVFGDFLATLSVSILKNGLFLVFRANIPETDKL